MEQFSVTDYLKNSYEKYPERCACIDDAGILSYRELYELSDKAAYNISKKVSYGTPIPVIMKKSREALIMLWGVIKAGCCYVIIDSSQPLVRMESILSTIDAKYAIADAMSSKKLSGIDVEILKPDELIILTESVNVVEPGNADKLSSVGESAIAIQKRLAQIAMSRVDTDPLYIMFTSGSTGVPKGVLVNHRSVIDFIDKFTGLFNISNEDIIGNQAPWDFDVSVKDIFSAASTGAALRLIPKKYFSLPVDLVNMLDKDKVTTLIWAVSALVILSSRGALEKKAPKYINKIIFSGEVMPVKQYNIWRGFYPDAMFVNVYGPTEITCNCTYHIVKGLYKEDEVIPAGKAFPNERVFLLSDDDKLITMDETGVEGEICVSGTAVTMGYYNNPEETTKRFVQNPLNDIYDEKIYRTGDLAYYDKNGDLCYTSRKDFQIKHMGHRIELTEIERCINSLENIRMSCCIYHNETIIAFIEGVSEEKAIISEMRKVLPSFMIPEKFVFLNSMPFNNNGKIDRKGLIENYG